MKRLVHYIADDLETVMGYARWEWPAMRNISDKFTALLKAHAELSRRYPEDVNETSD